MFAKKPDKSAKEAEQRQIEQLKNRCAGMLERIREAAEGGDTNGAERGGKQLLEMMKNPKLPLDFKREVSAMAKGAERDAFMKATDEALKRAAAFAQADKTKERSAEISKARTMLGRAASLGCGEEFRTVTQHKIDTIMLTGGVKWQGPTRAKPVDNSPKPKNMAKMFETAESAPATPKRR